MVNRIVVGQPAHALAADPALAATAKRVKAGRGCCLLIGSLAALAVSALAVEADQVGAWPGAALEEGAAALLELLPGEAFEAHGIVAQDAAAAVVSAITPHYWQPIESAPRDRQILLGLRTGSSFQVAIGHWEVHDEVILEELTGGEWSTAAWWGTDPTHWTQIPPPPPASD